MTLRFVFYNNFPISEMFKWIEVLGIQIFITSTCTKFPKLVSMHSNNGHSNILTQVNHINFFPNKIKLKCEIWFEIKIHLCCIYSIIQKHLTCVGNDIMKSTHFYDFNISSKACSDPLAWLKAFRSCVRSRCSTAIFSLLGERCMADRQLFGGRFRFSSLWNVNHENVRDFFSRAVTMV